MPRLLIEKGFSQLLMKTTTVFTIDRLAKAFRNTGKPITFTTRILSLLNEAKLPPTIATYWLGMRVKANALTGVYAFVQFQCLASQHTMAALIGGTTVHGWGKVPVNATQLFQAARNMGS